MVLGVEALAEAAAVKLVVVLALVLLAACAQPAPAPTSSPSSVATPSLPAPSPLLVDACHQGGKTFCQLNPNVTQATIHQTICVSGWTATVRPPESYTSALKRQQMAAEGLSGTTRDYEEDHRMPLEVGGDPVSHDNLSPERGASPNPKDHDETQFKDEVCAGQLMLAQAQASLVAKWLAPWPGYK